MKDRANFYLSMLLMFVAGAIAMWVIARIATQRGQAPVVGGTEASYNNLKNSILNN